MGNVAREHASAKKRAKEMHQEKKMAPGIKNIMAASHGRLTEARAKTVMLRNKELVRNSK